MIKCLDESPYLHRKMYTAQNATRVSDLTWDLYMYDIGNPNMLMIANAEKTTIRSSSGVRLCFTMKDLLICTEVIQSELHDRSRSMPFADLVSF